MENEAGWNLLISGSAQPLPLSVADIKEEVEGDYEFKMKFEKSFYGKESVKTVTQDNYLIRGAMIKNFGANFMR